MSRSVEVGGVRLERGGRVGGRNSGIGGLGERGKRGRSFVKIEN